MSYVYVVFLSMRNKIHKEEDGQIERVPNDDRNSEGKRGVEFRTF